MIEADGDIAVLGSSFAGSLMALVLQRMGLRPILVDKRSHPRFALGESTTPIANIVLRDLAEKYDLPRLAPLTRYGTWQRDLPHLVCGRKRGFSFFKHKAGEGFQTDSLHSSELLVTSSLDNERCDTQWLRSDVDAYFAAEAERCQILHLDRTDVSVIEPTARGGWLLRGDRNGEPVRIAADFLIDSTGDGGVLGRLLGLEAERRNFCTNSRAIYAHFAELEKWHDVMADSGHSVADHPFDCDDATVHHILDGAWMWQIRFNNGVTSAGLVLDNARHPLNADVMPEEEWRRWLSQYPAVAKQFSQARIVGPTPNEFVRTGRLQRQWATLVGPNWAMLPQTAGIIDALFSTGIAQSLCGIERLASIFERDWKRSRFVESLREYEEAVRSEIAFVDELVGACFRTFDRFDMFVATSMLYFAAATTNEKRRIEHGSTGTQFLCADDLELRGAVRRISQSIEQMADGEMKNCDGQDFAATVAKAIEPFNTAGLCDPKVCNMYRYTAPAD